MNRPCPTKLHARQRRGGMRRLCHVQRHSSLKILALLSSFYDEVHPSVFSQKEPPTQNAEHLGSLLLEFALLRHSLPATVEAA